MWIDHFINNWDKQNQKVKTPKILALLLLLCNKQFPFHWTCLMQEDTYAITSQLNQSLHHNRQNMFLLFVRDEQLDSAAGPVISYLIHDRVVYFNSIQQV